MVTDSIVTPASVMQRLGEASHRRCSGGQHYEYLDVFYKNSQQLMAIKSNALIGGVRQTRIEMNPSNFGRYYELASICNDLFDLSELEIKRIDHRVDLKIPFAQIRKSIFAKRKNTRSDFRGPSSLGLWAGSNPEVLCVYDKAMELRSKYRKSGFKRIRGEEVGLSTRIEVRQYKEKLQCFRFLDLPNCLNSDPFHFVEFYDFVDVESLSKVEQNKFYKLKSEALENGFIGAYKNENQHCNFTRDYSGVIELSKLTQDIKRIYKQNLNQYFNITEKC